MNKTLLIVLLCIASTFCEIVVMSETTEPKLNEDDVKQYDMLFKGNYSGSELVYRQIVFKTNKDQYEISNSEAENTFTLGVNQFSTLTFKEFATTYLNLNVPAKSKMLAGSYQAPFTVTNVDWRSSITSVKNQGSCGSCWAFSAIGALEAAIVITKKGDPKTLDLSEQELVDCAGSFGNQGCNGGWMSSAFKYIMKFGISTEKQYPYTGKNQTCKTKFNAYSMKNYKQYYTCANLANALVTGPVTVAVDATVWGAYKGGVLNKCGTNLNHGVILVGANSTSNVWTIKNSWGINWGEKGFIRLPANNTCGVCSASSIPTL